MRFVAHGVGLVIRSGFVATLVAGAALVTVPSVVAAPPPPESGPVRVDARLTSLRQAPVAADGVARAVRTDTTFSMIGVRWTGAAPDQVEVRSRSLDGSWSEWTELEPSDAQPERGRASSTTEPVWTGPSREVEVRANRLGRPITQGLELVTIDPGSRPADAQLSAPRRAGVASVADRPAVVSRAAWGADERLMTWAPEYATTTKAVAIHHTAGNNVYTCAESAGIVRGIYQYHAVTNGWGDIGYNVLVDACGTIFEGRSGGLDVPTIGAHAGGFNTHTFGISFMGEFGAGPPTDAAVEAASRIAAWKLATGYRDPRGSTVLVSAGGGTAKYPAGTAVTLPTIFGHRDTGNTACPGDAGYAQLERIRSRVVELAGDWRASPIYQKWQALGGESGLAGGVFQQEQPLSGGGQGAYFSGGGGVTITSHPTAGTHYLRDATQRAWVALGGTSWSYPTTDETPVPGTAGTVNDFANGSSIYWSAAGGAHAVGGPIEERWLQLGGVTRYGFPVSDEVPFDGGTRRQDFTRITMIYNPATGQFRFVPRFPGIPGR